MPYESKDKNVPGDAGGARCGGLSEAGGPTDVRCFRMCEYLLDEGCAVTELIEADIPHSGRSAMSPTASWKP